VALSSEIFGSQQSAPLSEASPLHPNNTYAAAKVFAYWVVRVFREQHGIHASSAILFNHESPRRDVHFVTRKITRAVAMIRAGRQEKLALGSLGSQRDWSFAGDFVRAMQLMVAHSKPDDYVLASGIVHSVRDFCEIAFEHVGLDYRHYVTETTEYGRVHEVGTRVGNPSKATTILRWKPRVTFRDLVEMMVDHDMKLVAEELNCAQN
jgi:GDPmannose 4,6-dehydratase